jgi:hypothetical protein
VSRPTSGASWSTKQGMNKETFGINWLIAPNPGKRKQS